jgi:CheY-like chemotaxis protein
VKYPSADGQVSLRVLLVDSDIQVLSLISTLLEHYGHDVRTAFSCKEALELADGFHPQVVVTGIALVVSSGFELAKRLRIRPDCVDTVIVALTGHVAELTPEEWTYAGFAHVLRKPANIDDIVSVLKVISAKRQPHLTLVR